jgi:hypothetical protein
VIDSDIIEKTARQLLYDLSCMMKSPQTWRTAFKVPGEYIMPEPHVYGPTAVSWAVFLFGELVSRRFSSAPQILDFAQPQT